MLKVIFKDHVPNSRYKLVPYSVRRKKWNVDKDFIIEVEAFWGLQVVLKECLHSEVNDVLPYLGWLSLE